MKAGRVVATVNGSALPSPVSRLSGSFSIWGSVPPWPADVQETEFVYQGWGEQKFSSFWQLKEEGGEQRRGGGDEEYVGLWRQRKIKMIGKKRGNWKRGTLQMAGIERRWLIQAGKQRHGAPSMQTKVWEIRIDPKNERMNPRIKGRRGMDWKRKDEIWKKRLAHPV